MSRFTETIAALATPAGTSAIAVVRVSGPDTAQLVRAIFGERFTARRLQHADYHDRAGVLVDDVLFVFFQGPRSYTGEDALEVSCHGNVFVTQRILEDLLARGCRMAEPGEFTQRAFLNGRMDLSQAEAVMDVIHARSERALAAAHRQLRGALGRRTAAAVNSLLGVLARVEAYIDFPDEDLPPEDREIVLEELRKIDAEASKILATNHYGDMLREGIKVVILGPPNVGKSSLLNRMVGWDRALVSAEPGTTRDFLEERIIAGPHCLRIIDTAGLNVAPQALERLGMVKTIERAKEADLFLLVTDITGVSFALDADIQSYMRDGNCIVVVNKCDLSASGVSPLPSFSFLNTPAVVRCSAQTGEGLDKLMSEIVCRADAFQGDAGEDEVAINARHASALCSAQEALAAAIAKVEAQEPSELLASDLRGALASFGEISGRVDNEQMLDQLFANFCIGK